MGDGKVITGDQIFLATGSRPRVLDIPGVWRRRCILGWEGGGVGVGRGVRGYGVVDWFSGVASFEGNILTQGYPFLCVFFRCVGLEGTPYMTSTEALRQTKFPASMVVIGGG